MIKGSFEHEVPLSEFPWIDSLLPNQTDKAIIFSYVIVIPWVVLSACTWK